MNPNPCLVKNGGCGQLCNDDNGHVTCSCNKGFALQDDGKSCAAMDIHEEGKIQYVNKDKDRCFSVAQDECKKIAGTKGIPFGKVRNNNNRFPPGCYHQKISNKVYYNDKFSNVECTEERVCICALGMLYANV